MATNKLLRPFPIPKDRRLAQVTESLFRALQQRQMATQNINSQTQDAAHSSKRGCDWWGCGPKPHLLNKDDIENSDFDEPTEEFDSDEELPLPKKKKLSHTEYTGSQLYGIRLPTLGAAMNTAIQAQRITTPIRNDIKYACLSTTIRCKDDVSTDDPVGWTVLIETLPWEKPNPTEDIQKKLNTERPIFDIGFNDLPQYSWTYDQPIAYQKGYATNINSDISNQQILMHVYS